MAIISREGVMLCYPAEEKRVAKLPPTIIAQPKLNGERCRVEWHSGRPCLLSSYGNQFRGLEHIEEALLEYLPHGHRWDGELYVHGWSRERIHSAVSRKTNASTEAREVQFHIFDVQDYEKSQISRCAAIQQHFYQIPCAADPLRMVETIGLDRSQWVHKCADYVSQGYEGIILRHPYGLYQDKRSTAILKFKPTEEDDYRIVGFEEEISIDGVPKDSLGAFIVTSDEGTVFAVGTGPALTKEKRKNFWIYRNQLLGHTLTVKHEKLRTVNNIPIATVAVRVKDWRN